MLLLNHNKSNQIIKSKCGPMSLMSPIGMLRDEGCWNTSKIVFNGMKKENRTRFKQMCTDPQKLE